MMELIAESLWYILPAYMSNMAPVLMGGGSPVDLGKRWMDGRRVLGDHKTWRGFASGMALGTLTGILQGDPIRGFLLSAGAMCGDLLGSFIKRRLGLPPGRDAPVLDHLDFVVVAMLFDLFHEHMSPGILISVLMMTPLLYELTNRIAKLLGLKR